MKFSDAQFASAMAGKSFTGGGEAMASNSIGRMPGPDYEARCKLLESELEEKSERIRQLETELGLELQAPVFLGLTKQEAIIFAVLYKRKVAFKSTFMAALYGENFDEGAEPKIIDVFICKMRPKLKAFDIHIETQWGEGYFMPVSSKERVGQLIDEKRE